LLPFTPPVAPSPANARRAGSTSLADAPFLPRSLRYRFARYGRGLEPALVFDHDCAQVFVQVFERESVRNYMRFLLQKTSGNACKFSIFLANG
jgi:hypothetical protein